MILSSHLGLLHGGLGHLLGWERARRKALPRLYSVCLPLLGSPTSHTGLSCTEPPCTRPLVEMDHTDPIWAAFLPVS